MERILMFVMAVLEKFVLKIWSLDRKVHCRISRAKKIVKVLHAPAHWYFDLVEVLMVQAVMRHCQVLSRQLNKTHVNMFYMFERFNENAWSCLCCGQDLPGEMPWGISGYCSYVCQMRDAS